jgi:hypothetical protein
MRFEAWLVCEKERLSARDEKIRSLLSLRINACADAAAHSVTSPLILIETALVLSVLDPFMVPTPGHQGLAPGCSKFPIPVIVCPTWVPDGFFLVTATFRHNTPTRFKVFDWVRDVSVSSARDGCRPEGVLSLDPSLRQGRGERMLNTYPDTGDHPPRCSV